MWTPMNAAACTSGSACAIPVPLGSVEWKFSADAINALVGQTNLTVWILNCQSKTPQNPVPFQASNPAQDSNYSYPTWTKVINNDNGAGNGQSRAVLLHENERRYMRSLHNFVFLGAVLGVLLESGSGAASQTTKPSPGTKPAFSINIRSESDNVRVGSEVRVKVVLTNTSDRAIDLLKSIGDTEGEDHNQIDVRDDHGNVAPDIKVKSGVERKEDGTFELHHSTSSEMLITLKPGQTLIYEMLATKLRDMSKPGKYAIQIQRSDPEIVKSNTIIVTVTP